MSLLGGDTVRLPDDGFMRGRYQILKRLGGGGFGDVWLALDEKLKRRVAIKTLKTQAGLDVDILKKEILKAQEVRADTVCQIYQFEDVEDSSPAFVVMEYVEGETLGKRLHDPGRPFDGLKGIELALDLCDGLDAIHRKGIVHLDIKPANIIVTPKGSGKILDLGIAKQAGEEIGATTRQYAPPELLKQHDFEAKPTSDVYALGVVLHMLFVGQHPFVIEGEGQWPTTDELIARQLRWSAEAIDKRVHSSLRDIINGCLQPVPEKRTGSVRQVYEALAESKRRFDSHKPKVGDQPPGGLSGFELIEQLEEDAMGSIWLAKDNFNGAQVVQFFSNERGHREVVVSHERALAIRELAETDETVTDRLPQILVDHLQVPYYVSWKSEPGWLPLQQWAQENPKSTFSEHQKIVEETAAALEILHQSKIVHGEIRPEVILVKGTGEDIRVRLRDPGRRLMRSSDRGPSGLSLPGEEYRAPELQEEEPSQSLFEDPSLDVYSLGVVFYRLWVKDFSAPIDGWPDLPPGPFSRKLSEMLSSNPAVRPADGLKLRLKLEGAREAAAERDKSKREIEEAQAGEAAAKKAQEEAEKQEQRKAEEAERSRQEAEEQKRLQEEERLRREAAEAEAQKSEEEAEAARQGEDEQRAKAKEARRRSKVLQAILAAGSILVVAGLFLWGIYENDRRERLAVQQTTQIVEDLLKLSNPDEGLGELLTAMRMIDQAMLRVEQDTQLRPSIKAAFFRQVGITYQGLGLSEKALEALKRASVLFEETLDSRKFWQKTRPRLQLIDTLAHLTRSALAVDGPESARAHIERAKDLAAGMNIGSGVVLLRQVDAEVLEAEGSLQEAEAEKRRNVDLNRARVEELSSDASDEEGKQAEIALGEALNDLGVNLYFQGRSADALPLVEEAEGIRKSIQKSIDKSVEKRYPENFRLLTVPFNLGYILLELRNFEDAKATFEEGIKTARSVWGDTHPKLADSLTGLGWVYDDLGDLAKAEEYFQENLRIRSHNWGSSHTRVAQAKQTLAYVLIRRGKYDEAANNLEEVLDTLGAATKPQDPAVLQAKRDLAWALTYTDPVKAESIYNELLRAWPEDEVPIDHAIALSDSADLLTHLERYDQARIRYSKALDLRQEAYGDTPDFSTGRASERLGDLELKAEDPAQAMRHFSAALGLYETLAGQESLDVARVRSKYALALAQCGELEQARQAIDKARGIFKTLAREGHWESSLAKAIDARIWWIEGNKVKARQLLEEAQEELDLRLGPNSSERASLVELG